MITLKGIPGSPGWVKGKARLIFSEEDFSRFQTGEILITKVTSPIWTPLFAIAGGVVTDFGGSLSHAAIVSREYGIPAVVGTRNATEIFKTGQTVEVNGNEGTVKRIMSL